MELREDHTPVLLPYQQAWVADCSLLKLWLKARQVGFSFAATYEAVMDCLERPRQTWVFLSASDRQALELAEKAKLHCDAIGGFIAEITSTEEFIEDFHYTKHELLLPNGGRIIALPANPRTARGYSGNIVLDEFAFHRDAKAIYSAVFPFTTRGYRIIIGSTPFGESGMFYELWSMQNAFSKHRVDIYEAVAQGLPADIEALRAGCPDEDIWQQEYCCQFISDATSWIPWELIIDAQSVNAGIELHPGFVPQGPLYLGIDIARHHDLTVFYLVEQLGDVLWTRAIRRLRHAPFNEQLSVARALLAECNRCAIDATGMGAPIAEQLQQEFGSRVEPINFTMLVKEALAVDLKRVFEEKRIRIPDERDLRSAIHAVRKYATAAGHFRFDADRTEKGHADEFWAAALAIYAAERPPLSTEYMVSTRLAASHAHLGRGSVYAGVRGY